MCPPYCTSCSNSCRWSSDFDAGDLGYEHEGVVGLYTCPNCCTDYEIRDFLIDDAEVRSLKYYLPNIEENDDIDFENINIDVNYCLYCKSALKQKTQYREDDKYITVKRCEECRADYKIVDEYLIDIEDVNYDNYVDESYNLYYGRTVVIE